MIVKIRTLLLLVLLSMASVEVFPISIPAFFSDNMVLQQNTEVKLWGWGKSQETVEVKVSWDTTVYKAVADNNAYWSVAVKTPKAGGPHSIVIKGYNTIKLNNVMTGEVWICSGQSNMEWAPAWGIDNAEEEIANANIPDIRFFSTDYRTAVYPQENVGGSWTECSPETMKNFSALAYFFAKQLRQEMGDIPIGLINSSWGGSPIEAWMTKESIVNDAFLKEGAALIGYMEWAPNEPGRAYNAMIAPFTRFKIAGALWYQGETNTGNPMYHEKMLSTLITAWRKEWGYDFPFYFAQIAPWQYEIPYQGAEVRDRQRRVLSLPQTGMVVTSDICDTTNIHPTNKQDAGKRLADIALVKHYKVKEAIVDGPLYAGHEVKASTIVVDFDNAEGLKCTEEDITYFELAGIDKIFHPAQARIQGTTVIVSSTEVKHPKYLRYAWFNTAVPNLVNVAGLPASCFATEY